MSTTRPSSAQRIAVTIRPTATGEPIHPYLYGQFSELLSNWFDQGLWAEMLSDRKFFYPVDSSPQLPRENRRPLNRWRPVGPDRFVTMDTDAPYVGAHTPRIQVEPDAPHGIRQSGLVLRRGRSYSCRVVLSGDPDVQVQVTLSWGSGAGEARTITIGRLATGYGKYALQFTAEGDTDDGFLEIVGVGSGHFHVGAVSLMPADHVHGFRADMLQLLKELDTGMWRWPGGNFVSGYDWRDGVGDADRRPPRYDYAWHTVESNDVGTDDYLVLCGLLGLEPYICVNAGFGDAHSAAQWVEYVNGSPDTPMGRLRAANGHPAPYGVKWWGIGNEMYGDWQLGYMALRHYVIKHNQIAEAMRAVDPSIVIVAAGASIHEQGSTCRHWRRPRTERLPFAYGSDEDWSGGLLAHCAAHMDMLSEHLYPPSTMAFDEETQTWVDLDAPLVDTVRRLPNRVKCLIESWDAYRERMPWLKDKAITLVIDEWAMGVGETRTGLGHALAVAETLHEMFRHTDIIKMGAYTAFASLLNYDQTRAIYRPAGLVFKLYRRHFGVIPVEVSGASPQHAVRGTVGVDIPKVSSGSDTYPVDVSAALTADRGTLTIAIVNPTEEEQRLDLQVEGLTLPDRRQRWLITGPSADAANVLGQAPAVTLDESTLSEPGARITVSPLSVTLYAFAIA